MDKDRPVSDYYRRAVEAMAHQDWEVAVGLLRECTALEPDKTLYQQLLRNSEKRRDDRDGRTS